MPYKSTKIIYPQPKTMYLASDTIYDNRVEAIKVHAESDKSYWIGVKSHLGKHETVRIVQKRSDFILHDTWEQARQHRINQFRNKVEFLRSQILHIEAQIKTIEERLIPEAEALADPTLLINTLS